MEFERISNTYNNELKKHGYYISDIEKYYNFIEDYNIIGVCWGQPTTISSSYFERLLLNGSSEIAHKGDNNSKSLSGFYSYLLDHGALWKQKDGKVLCTSFPYGTEKKIKDKYNEMMQTFEYPECLKIRFLEDRYRFRENGDCMVCIYCE